MLKLVLKTKPSFENLKLSKHVLVALWEKSPCHLYIFTPWMPPASHARDRRHVLPHTTACVASESCWIIPSHQSVVYININSGEVEKNPDCEMCKDQPDCLRYWPRFGINQHLLNSNSAPTGFILELRPLTAMGKYAQQIFRTETLHRTQWRTQKIFMGGFIQWHMVVICIWCAFFVTSPFDVIFVFSSEVCWHKSHILLHALPLFL